MGLQVRKTISQKPEEKHETANPNRKAIVPSSALSAGALRSIHAYLIEPLADTPKNDCLEERWGQTLLDERPGCVLEVKAGISSMRRKRRMEGGVPVVSHHSHASGATGRAVLQIVIHFQVPSLEWTGFVFVTAKHTYPLELLTTCRLIPYPFCVVQPLGSLTSTVKGVKSRYPFLWSPSFWALGS